jgi:hypothetical protein
MSNTETHMFDLLTHLITENTRLHKLNEELMTMVIAERDAELRARHKHIISLLSADTDQQHSDILEEIRHKVEKEEAAAACFKKQQEDAEVVEGDMQKKGDMSDEELDALEKTFRVLFERHRPCANPVNMFFEPNDKHSEADKIKLNARFNKVKASFFNSNKVDSAKWCEACGDSEPSRNEAGQTEEECVDEANADEEEDDDSVNNVD